jgi:hypothetical protein
MPVTKRPAAPPREASEAARRLKSLTPAMRRALWWLADDERVARFAACDLTRAAPKASTLDALAERGLARPITNAYNWWRITGLGREVRRLADGAFQAERVTA